MEEDEDDFYGGKAEPQELQEDGDAEVKAEQMDVSEEQEEEEEDEDDVQFTLEKPEGAKSEQPTRPSIRPTPSHDRKPSAELKTSKQPTPAIKTEQPLRSTSTAPPPTQQQQPSRPTTSLLTHNGKEGKDYPAPRTSKLDLDTIPLWPPANKPLTHLDIDADLAESSKPWRLPGTDQTDFFNYGFDEYAWTQYCVKQQSMAQGIAEQRAADAQMKAMFGGGAPGMPGGGGMGGGMPDGMEAMMQQMMGGGGPPGGMDFGQMMQMMGGPQGPGMPPQGPGGFGGFGGGQGSASPAPGQGFQPPQGPGQGGGGGDMTGYSPQQMAIMQMNEQGGGHGGGGGGGRGRGRRGRW